MKWETWKIIITALLSAALTIIGGATATQVGGCWNPPFPKPPDIDTPPPDGAPDPIHSIGKIALQGGYCSGTVIGPRQSDGRWRIVSAAHCFKRAGEDATFIQRTGVSRKITCIALDRRADIAICVTDANQGSMAFTYIADRTPAAGTKVMHAGYGRHIPGNVEKGEVLGGPNDDNQVKYHLSVSPGDSGGGIVIDDAGHLLSPVCCTTRLDGPGNVWGGSPEHIRRMIATPTDYIELAPIEMPPPPIEMPAKGDDKK